MKRTFLTYLLAIVYLIGGFSLSVSSVFASIAFNDSRALTLGNNSLTLYMGQDGSSFYLDAVNPSGKPLSCEVKDGNTLIQRSNCAQQSFSYNGSTSELKIYVQLDNDQGTWIYDTYNRTFTSALRGTTDVTNNNTSYNNSTNSSLISLSTSISSPSIYQSVGLTVRLYNSYGNVDTNFTDQVRFTVSKLDSYGTYYTANTNDYYISNNYYTFSSSDDGYIYLPNYLQFYANGTYKVRVENTTNGAMSDVTVYVGSSYCTTCNNNNTSSTSSFLLESSTSYPTTNQYITTTLTARDSNSSRDYNYQGTVRFSVEKRDNTYSSWYAASSSDYSLSQVTSYLGSSQQGYLSFSNNLRFYNSGLYRLKVVDDNNSYIAGYREFDVSGTNSNNQSNSISVDVSNTNPSSSQYINTTTTLKDSNGNRNYSYQGTIRYVVEKRDSNAYNWYTAASNDYYLSTSTNYFYTSDQGYKNISSHVMFYNNGYYRIKAYDDSNSNVYGYSSTITVGNSSSTSTYNRFDLSTNTNTPGRDNFANLTIVAKDTNGYTLSSYSNRVKFQISRRMYTSDNWTDITSSSLDNSTYRIYDTSYTFPSYNNGTVTLTNFIKFYSDSYDYKVRVVDDYNNSVYGEIIYYLRNTSSASNNNTSTTSAYRFAGTLDSTVPELNSYFDVKLYARDSSNRTVTNYNRTIRISIEKKSLASSTSWSSASSTYCRLNRTSYTFSSSDYGYATLSDIARCSKKGFYRLKLVDDNSSSVYGYVYFTVVDSEDFVDSLAGFTSSQRETTHELYKTFMSKVNERELNNTVLARSSSWATTRRNYYNKLNALAYNKTGRLRTYSLFLDAADNFASAYNNLVR